MRSAKYPECHRTAHLDVVRKLGSTSYPPHNKVSGEKSERIPQDARPRAPARAPRWQVQAEGEGNLCLGPWEDSSTKGVPATHLVTQRATPQTAGHHPWMPLEAPVVLGKKPGRLPRKDTLLQLIIYILIFFLFTSLVSCSYFCCNRQIVRLR